MRLPVKACVLLFLSQSAYSSSGVLDPHGPIGGAERTILFNATAIMLAVVVPVITGSGYLLTVRLLERVQPGAGEEPKDYEFQPSSGE